MTVCQWCQQDMTAESAATCSQTVQYPDGETLAPIPYAAYEDMPTMRCHDCNVAPGGLHHPGCDDERCPRCGGQLIGCDCLSGV